MFYGRIRPFYGLVFGFLRARGEALCPLVFIIVVLQYMVNISGRKIFVFEKILLYFLVFGFIKKFEELFLIAKTCFCVHSVGAGGWIKIFIQRCVERKK